MSAVERAAALRAEANAAVPAALIALLRSVKRIWVVPHERPDGDALGAALGLQGILAQRGVEVAVLILPSGLAASSFLRPKNVIVAWHFVRCRKFS